MKEGKILLGCVSVLVALASSVLWAMLLYLTMEKVEATPLMWSLFWSYVPLTIILSIISQAISKLSKGE